ncbi:MULTISPECIES: fimbrial biogenesis chaperone [Enterobacter]|uniref:fimbrial biogenesis chaperone n=1 Tax=Enterobacter TaxID=547 RepID=UPI00077BD9AA|nr:molecular chaperone [Enterobacter pseudoroggenkampii]MCX8288165.1 molecular chaperone [Enterobacter pseudoroggenkampii]WJW87826.1 molecular chaperone [Enterobacter pseudoroggenkampii]
MHFISKALLISAALTASFSNAYAGVIIGGTRVIFDGGKKEASISINNADSVPYLIQSWVDMPEGNANKAPFIVTPPLYRLDGGQQNIERILLSGSLPQDKESLFWLNIKAIPSASKQENSLQIAVKTRIKLIYRPSGLKGTTPEEQANKLTWSRSGNKLKVTNPTQYVINFNEISVGDKKLDEVSWVAPGATAVFSLPAGANGNHISFKVINDYGSPGRMYQASF